MFCLQVKQPSNLEENIFQAILGEKEFQGKCHLDIGSAWINFRSKDVAFEAERFVKDRFAMSHPGSRIVMNIFEWNN